MLGRGLLSVVSKVFKKCINNRIADNIKKCDLFSDFQYGFSSSQSTAYLLTVVSFKKKLYGPFLWMGFNCLKATATSRRQFTFYHSVPRNSWNSFYQPQKDRITRAFNRSGATLAVALDISKAFDRV